MGHIGSWINSFLLSRKQIVIAIGHKLKEADTGCWQKNGNLFDAKYLSGSRTQGSSIIGQINNITHTLGTMR